MTGYTHAPRQLHPKRHPEYYVYNTLHRDEVMETQRKISTAYWKLGRWS